MRILVVSAHYPPNFVSGGTLAPQRQAQGFRQRGHDVSVYAGWLGGERPTLSSWTETDETGMDLRWVVTTPWVDWGHEANFDNPEVTADFASHLAVVRPDVVHLHSLQSLGGALVSAAADSGARVVVTMHDFWWLCGRQFLVDTEYRPCCLVVSCGVCACQVDRSWLDSRQARLAAHLQRADVILAVSTAQAKVLLANGVDSGRLRIDENAVPDIDLRRSVLSGASHSERESGAPLRLTYAGGPDRMKGVHVLLEAVRLIDDQEGWHLTAYGIQPFLDQTEPAPGATPVVASPPYDPAEVDSVFASTDVLVLPSVMRETYSLITREALIRGIPVVCTDTLGPEEVVEDEVNGLVVPAGDPLALAEALRRLVCEEGLLDRLREGCRRRRHDRSVGEQLDGLDALYKELTDPLRGRTGSGGPQREGSPARKVRRVLFVVGIEGAPLRYRARLPAEAMALLGVHSDVCHYRDPAIEELAADADALVVYRVPATHQVLSLIAAVRARGTPVFFDVDDLIFDPDLRAEIPALAILEGAEADLWMEGVHRYRTTMEACDVFIGSTELLCRHAEQVVGLPSARFANGVGIALARAADLALSRPRAPGLVRIGYLSGTNTHDRDWRLVEPAVASLLAEQADVELWLGGHVDPSPALDVYGDRVRRLPFLPWLELPGVLRDLDVNLAPLERGSRFNEAKSAIKWLEAALTATPTIASPTEAFSEAVEHGRNGLLADTPEEWATALRSLATDPARRAQLGHRARRDALLRWSPHLQGPRYLAILEAAWGDKSFIRPAGEWEPVAHDEPFATVALEPYGGGLGSRHSDNAAVTSASRRTSTTPGGARAGWLAHAGSLCRRAGRSIERDGILTTGLRLLRVNRRQRPRVAASLASAMSAVRSKWKGRRDGHRH